MSQNSRPTVQILSCTAATTVKAGFGRTPLPDIYWDDSDPTLILAIFNADPSQQLSVDTSHNRAVSAHRFRQILITPKSDAVASRVSLSLMPMLTFIEDSQGGATCRPQVIGRLPTWALAESGGETELKSRFSQAWLDSSLQETIEVDNNEEILAAIKEIEKVAESVSQSYPTSCRIVDNKDKESESLFSGEWYGPQRYESYVSSTYYAITDFTRPIGLQLDGQLKYVGMLYIGNDEPTFHIKHCALSGLSRSDHMLMIDTLNSAGRFFSAESLVSAILGCDADIDAANTQTEISATTAAIRGRRGQEPRITVSQRGPLRIPVHKLVAASDAVTLAYGSAMVQRVNLAFQQARANQPEGSEPTTTPTIMRIKLRPGNLLHMDYHQAIARVSNGQEPYSSI